LGEFICSRFCGYAAIPFNVVQDRQINQVLIIYIIEIDIAIVHKFSPSKISMLNVRHGRKYFCPCLSNPYQKTQVKSHLAIRGGDHTPITDHNEMQYFCQRPQLVFTKHAEMKLHQARLMR
jgi:hypothetical protein